MDATDQSTIRLAVLIDADNTQPAVVAPLLAEVAKYGTAHVRPRLGLIKAIRPDRLDREFQYAQP